MKEKTLSEFVTENKRVDYQVKKDELAKEMLFLQKYTPLDSDTCEQEEDL